MFSFRRTSGTLALAVVAALSFSASALSETSGWRVIKSKSVTGAFAVTAASATVKRPKGVAVRFIGRRVRGSVVWACSKGSSVASWSRRREYGPGLYALRHVRGKDSCNVTASVTGEGRITLQILKR